MDETTQSPINSNIPASALHFAPAQLWFGSHDLLFDQTVDYLRQTFCKKNGCGSCSICRQIRDQQFYGAHWLIPEKNYTLDEIAIIFKTISFMLAPNEKFFFIIQKADFLTQVCANSLLKSIEEPPPGYHFILLAERPELILPTIRSRCIIKNFGRSDALTSSALFKFFNGTPHHLNALDFTTALDESKINERETIELLDILFAHWITEYTKALQNNADTTHIEYMIDKIKSALSIPLMPGSSKLFWKNLFLQTQK